jgi:dihydroorotate dehydrogenase (NAD+) catalytic subunit
MCLLRTTTLFEAQGTTKYSLAFERPLLNAAGSLGFTPDWRDVPELHNLGAFFTNPVSLGARTPASGTRFLAYPGGFLLHSGYPNPGLKRVLQQYSQSWARQPLPVWVHLLAQNPGELGQMVRFLEGREGVAGIEVGLAAEVDRLSAQAFTAASLGELPVIVRVPLERAYDLAPAVMRAGASAVSLGPPRGGLPSPESRLISGRMYGPATFPQALETVKALVRLGISVIGAGGVYQPADVEAMLSAGAIAVQIDTALWRGWGEPG